MKAPFNLFNSPSDLPRITELRAITLFKDLNSRELREVDELLHERTYQKGEIIFDAGDVGLGLFIVVSGRVQASSTRQGAENLSAEFCCGDFFGEISLFDDSQRTSRVIATEPSRVLALFRTEFFSLLERNHSIGTKILLALSRTVCHRLRRVLMGERQASCP
jgi:CRP/FNR family cyclic AMP-dependent transcriptional regulator